MSYKLYKRSLIWSEAPHLEKKLSIIKTKKLLKQNNALILRNIYNFDIENETSFWYIIKDSFGGMEELSSKTRNQIRRAQKLLEIKKVDKKLIFEQGYEVYSSSFKKYKNIAVSPLNKSDFLKGLQHDFKGEEFWGCIDKADGKLIAYAHNIIQNNMCNYNSMKAIPEYLTGYYPYYGLIYLMNEYYLETRGLKYVSDGARSITEHSNIQPFLINKLNFRKAYCNLTISYIYWLKPIIKILYPIRKYIWNLQIKAILHQEAINRGF